MTDVLARVLGRDEEGLIVTIATETVELERVPIRGEWFVTGDDQHLVVTRVFWKEGINPIIDLHSLTDEEAKRSLL